MMKKPKTKYWVRGFLFGAVYIMLQQSSYHMMLRQSTNYTVTVAMESFIMPTRNTLSPEAEAHLLRWIRSVTVSLENERKLSFLKKRAGIDDAIKRLERCRNKLEAEGASNM
jgi:hypothetical protein